MNNQILDYFKKGFFLVNKSWDLFLFGLLLFLLGGIYQLFTDSSINRILQIISYLLIFIEFGFIFSLPAFLIDRQQGKPLSLNNILSVTLKNTKRLTLPLLLILVALFIFLILGTTLIAQFIYGGNPNFAQNSNIGILLSYLLIGIYSFISAFAPIYFSIEKNGFFSSIKKSINLSIKNFNFIIIIFLISASSYLIATFVLDNNQSAYQLLLENALYQYGGLLTSASSLILYQNLKS